MLIKIKIDKKKQKMLVQIRNVVFSMTSDQAIKLIDKLRAGAIELDLAKGFETKKAKAEPLGQWMVNTVKAAKRSAGVVLAVLFLNGCASIDRGAKWFFRVPEGHQFNHFERRWEVVPMEKCDTIRAGTMNEKSEEAMIKNQRREAPAERDCQIKWRATEEEFEFFVRSIHPKTVQDAELKRWFPKNWRERLDALRKEQRAAGLPDSTFAYGERPRKRLAA